jgi:NAD(P)-dependent dehydrogenase (short-subunit alcohol dehydrogenase family)
MTDYLDRLFSLHGHTALVTGGSSGIGLGMSLALGRAGARVVLVARDQEGLLVTAGELASAGCQAAWVSADLGDRAQLERVAQAGRGRFR